MKKEEIKTEYIWRSVLEAGHLGEWGRNWRMILKWLGQYRFLSRSYGIHYSVILP
jgi:hypothetical protein